MGNYLGMKGSRTVWLMVTKTVGQNGGYCITQLKTARIYVVEKRLPRCERLIAAFCSTDTSDPRLPREAPVLFGTELPEPLEFSHDAAVPRLYTT